MKRILAIFLLLVVLTLYLLSRDYHNHKDVFYGVSFSRFHSDELKLDWKEVYLAILNDLKVKKFRFSAHWHLTEPEQGKYNFEELDFQMKEAQRAGASVILAVGRRLPGWPECHVPEWVEKDHQELSADGVQLTDSGKDFLLKYVETVVNRYKSYDNILYWQVENEPYLAFFSRFRCGKLDEEFLKKEIDLVRSLDPSRPIIVTDSGEFGLWNKAYQSGDVFGTSMYLYIWNRTLGPLRYPITPGFFRIKRNLIEKLNDPKQAIVIELSAEPWLLQPIVETPIETLLERMGIDKFNEMIEFSSKTSFDTFYLWGAEWWYYMKGKDHPEFWQRASELFK